MPNNEIRHQPHDIHKADILTLTVKPSVCVSAFELLEMRVNESLVRWISQQPIATAAIL